jgi:hypothetical protein
MNDLKTFFDRPHSPNHAKSTNGTANGARPIAAGTRQMLGCIATQGVRHRATQPTIPKIISNLFISLPRPGFPCQFLRWSSESPHILRSAAAPVNKVIVAISVEPKAMWAHEAKVESWPSDNPMNPTIIIPADAKAANTNITFIAFSPNSYQRLGRSW